MDGTLFEAGEGVMSDLKPCTMTACWTCTGCHHGHHDECRKTVTCPSDLREHVCVCCGSKQ